MANYAPPPQQPQGNGPPWGNPNAPPGYAQPPYQQGPPPKKGMPTWVIVLIAVGAFVIVIGGVLSTLAIYGVRKYIATAKAAEAVASLGALGIDAASAYEKGTTNSHGQSVHRMCPSASASVPASITSVRGMKYMSTPAEWDADRARNGGFACLGFSMATPQYFLYRYSANGSSKVGDSFDAEADGDLAGDGKLSTYHLKGAIGTDHSLEITAKPSIGQ